MQESFPEQASVVTVIQVAYEVGRDNTTKLLATTDTACRKSVAGPGWLQGCLKLAKEAGGEAALHQLSRRLSLRCLKVVWGFLRSYAGAFDAREELPLEGLHCPGRSLLLSRKVLSRLGMFYDVERRTAEFKHLGIPLRHLLTTEWAHCNAC